MAINLFRFHIQGNVFDPVPRVASRYQTPIGVVEKLNSVALNGKNQAPDSPAACIFRRRATTLRPFSRASASAVGWPAIPP